jgi:transposase
VRFEYRTHAPLCASAKRSACHRQCAAQSRQEYDADCLALARGHGSRHDPRIGSANAAAFETYVEQLLLPSLHAGQIVVMDNLRAHKGERVCQAIEAKGCQVLFLPGYSPDFSPIEETFSKLKMYLRRAGARTREALEEAICQALLTVRALSGAWLVQPLWLCSG